MDARGLRVTCACAAEVDAVDTFAERCVRLAPGAEAVLAAAERSPDVPMLQLAAAVVHLFAQTEAGDRAARTWLDRAAALARHATPREERLRAALEAWQAHAFADAVTCLESLTAEWPADLLAAKLAEFLYYVLGQEHEAARFRRHMERLAAHHPTNPDFLAMLAFARELSGATDGARATAERALAIDPQTAWAHHALSHVWIRAGAVDEAIRRLGAALPRWAASGRAIHSHNAWHLAVHHLERLDVGAARAVLHDDILRDGEEDAVGPTIDAIALAWRMELAGADAGAEWPALADRAERHAAACVFPFLSAHVAYALARAGRDRALDRLRAAVDARATAGDGEARRAWTPVGCAVIAAAAALGAGDPGRAATALAPVIDDVTVVGGSDAQCDVFRQTFLVALARSGARADARAWRERMRPPAMPTPLDDHWRALVA